MVAVVLTIMSAMGVGAMAASDNANRIDEQMMVSFEGEPGTYFEATLRVFHANGQEVHELAGEVPSYHEYQGTGLESIVRQTSQNGRLSVEVRKAGNVSRSSTNGKNSRIHLSIR